MTKPSLQLPIELSGVVQGRSYLCRIGDVDVELTNAELEVLVDLLCARLSSATGLSHLPCVPNDNKNHKHQLIYRLRQAIDESLGEGVGRKIVVNGPRTSFYLNVPTTAIFIHETVSELAPYHLSHSVVRQLLNAVPKGCK